MGNKKQNDIGICGPINPPNYRILTQTFVSRKHYEIFKCYFPVQIKNWWCDDWINFVYYPNYVTKLKKLNAVNKGGMGVHEFGVRFDNSSLNDLCPGYGSQGSMKTTTLGWNWQLTNNNRIMFNYIMAKLDAEAVDEITSLAPGASFNGTLTNSYGNENKVNVFGIRFQNNW